MVVLQGCGAQGIGGTDPLGHRAGDDCVIGCCMADLRPANLGPFLALLAEFVISTLTVRQRQAYVVACEGYEGPLARPRTPRGSARQYIGAVHHVTLQALGAVGPEGALHTQHLAVLSRAGYGIARGRGRPEPPPREQEDHRAVRNISRISPRGPDTTESLSPSGEGIERSRE